MLTRLHSSRMRTARALTVYHSMLGGGGVCVCSRGVSAPGGGGVSALGGVCSGGSAPGEGVSAWGGLLGGCLLRGGGHLLRGGGCLLPPVNRITDACKNITLPQLRCGR